MDKEQNVYVQFSNYNYSFNYFYESYRDLCIDISETMNIRKVHTRIYTFISEFSYAIPNTGKQIKFINKLLELQKQYREDNNLQKLINKRRDLITKEEIIYLKIYYRLLLKYMKILGEFSTELSSTLMPSLNINQKLIRYSNNQLFFDKLTEIKKKLNEKLAGFRIDHFKDTINLFITYFYAYNMFVSESNKDFIQKAIKLIIEKVTQDKTLIIISKIPKLLPEDKEFLYNAEKRVHELLMISNVKINESMSDFNILPKINKRVDVDRCLI